MSYPSVDSVVPVDVTSAAAASAASPATIAAAVAKQTSRVGCVTDAWNIHSVSNGLPISDISSLRNKSAANGNLNVDGSSIVQFVSEYRIVEGKKYVESGFIDDVGVEVESLRVRSQTAVSLQNEQRMLEVAHLSSKWASTSRSRVGLTLEFDNSSGSFWSSNTNAYLVVVLERGNTLFVRANTRGADYAYENEHLRMPASSGSIDNEIGSFPSDVITQADFSADFADGIFSSVMRRDLDADSDGVARTVAIIRPSALDPTQGAVLVSVTELDSTTNAISTLRRSEALYTGEVRVRMFVHFELPYASAARFLPADRNIVVIKGISPPNLLFVNAALGTKRDGATVVRTLDLQQFAPRLVSDVAAGQQVFLTSTSVLWRDALLGNFACVFRGAVRDRAFAPTCFISGMGMVNPTASGGEGTAKRVQAWLMNAPSRSVLVPGDLFEPSADTARTVAVLRCFDRYSTSDTGSTVHAGVRSLTPLHNHTRCALQFEEPIFIQNTCSFVDESNNMTTAIVVLTNMDGLGSSVACVGAFSEGVGIPRVCGETNWSNDTSALRAAELAAGCTGTLLTDMWNVWVQGTSNSVRIKTSSNSSGVVTTGLILSSPSDITLHQLDVPLVRLESKWPASELTAVALCASGVFNGSNLSSNASIRADSPAYRVLAVGEGVNIPLYCAMLRTVEKTTGSESATVPTHYSCEHSRLDLPRVFSESVASPYALRPGAVVVEIGFRGGNATMIQIAGEGDLESDGKEDYEDLFPILELSGICPPRAAVFAPFQQRITYMHEPIHHSFIDAAPPLVVPLPWPVRFLGESYDRVVIPRSRVAFLMAAPAPTEFMDGDDDPRSLPSCPGIVVVGQGTSHLEQVETRLAPDGRAFRILARGVVEYGDGVSAPFCVALELAREERATMTVRVIAARFFSASLAAADADDYRGGLVAERPASVPAQMVGGEASTAFNPQTRRTYWFFRVPFASGRSYVIAESAFPSVRLSVALDAVAPYAWDTQVERAKAQQLRLMQSNVWGASFALMTRGARVRACMAESVERQHGIMKTFRITPDQQPVDDFVLTLRKPGYKSDYTHDTSRFGAAEISVFDMSTSPAAAGLAAALGYNNCTGAAEFAAPVRFSEPPEATEEDEEGEAAATTLATLKSTPQSWGLRSDKQKLFPPPMRSNARQTMVRSFGDAFGPAPTFARRAKPRTF
jgi:hypothetical protein